MQMKSKIKVSDGGELWGKYFWTKLTGRYKSCFDQIELVCFSPDCVRAILDFEDACHSYLVFECGTLLRSILTFVPEDALGDTTQRF